MRGLVLWQPWATLVALDLKNWETRSWPTSYRGELLIIAAKRPPVKTVETATALMFNKNAVYEHLGMNHGGDYEAVLAAMPLGKAVCMRMLEACVSTSEIVDDIEATERELGNYSPGRYAWEMGPGHNLFEPLPIRGRQGLFTISPEDVAKVRNLYVTNN